MPSYKINNEQQLKLLLEKTAEEIADKIAKDTKAKLRENTRVRWYDTFSPESYDRTYNLLNSITIQDVSHGDEIIKNVGFDTQYLEVHLVDDGKFNAHADMRNNPFNKENLIEVIEEGTKTDGSLSVREKEGAHMIEETAKWLDKHITTEIRNQLKNKFGSEVSLRKFK